MADRLNKDFADSNPLFICVLNGSFMFASDLLKQITIPGTEIAFIKISSYVGTGSTGEVKEVFGLNKDIDGRTVIILEDIVDTGCSMDYLLQYLEKKNPANIVTATLFFKPKALVRNIKVDYHAIELENDFVVGRGLDYEDLGRNLPDLYILKQEE